VGNWGVVGIAAEEERLVGVVGSRLVGEMTVVGGVGSRLVGEGMAVVVVVVVGSIECGIAELVVRMREEVRSVAELHCLLVEEDSIETLRGH